MSSPSISVLMSAYNADQYIGEAIDSILNQTYKDFEFIIIDDASTDNTLSIIRSYKYERMKILVNEKNLGLSASLNKGLRMAVGKYIARMDADDISHFRRLERLYNYLEKNSDIDVCGSSMQLFGNDNSVRGRNLTEDAEIKAELIWRCAMAHATMLIRMDKIKEHALFYDESFRVGQDWKFWHDVKNYVKIANLNEPLYFYRRGEQNVTFQFRQHSKERALVMHRLMLDDLGISFSERELKLHQFIIGMFSIAPSPRAVKDARIWMEKLLKYNRKVKKYSPDVFKETAMKNWRRLFYRLVPFGFSIVVSYFRVSGIKKDHLLFYLKYTINKFIGRK